MQKIGIFGGSFNPFHIGHQKIIENVIESSLIDRLIIVPNFQNPLKTNRSDQQWQRFDQIETMIERYSNIELDFYEVNKKGISYTYHTLDYLQKKYPDNDWYLIIGSDVLNHFEQWYKWDQILLYAHLLVFLRKGYENTQTNPDILSKSYSLDFDIPQISSSQLRQSTK